MASQTVYDLRRPSHCKGRCVRETASHSVSELRSPSRQRSRHSFPVSVRVAETWSMSGSESLPPILSRRLCRGVRVAASESRCRSQGCENESEMQRPSQCWSRGQRPSDRVGSSKILSLQHLRSSSATTFHAPPVNWCCPTSSTPHPPSPYPCSTAPIPSPCHTPGTGLHRHCWGARGGRGTACGPCCGPCCGALLAGGRRERCVSCGPGLSGPRARTP